MSEHVAFSHSLSQESNWKRVFCWWWGHEYFIVRGLLVGDEVMVCLRCFCSVPLHPTCCRPSSVTSETKEGETP